MKNKIGIWLVLGLIITGIMGLLFTGCEPSKPKGKDGYTFEQATWIQPNVQIKVVMVPNAVEMNKIFKERGNKLAESRELMAFAVLTPAKPEQCTIYIVDPQVRYQPEWLGHEFAHCLFGEWHKKQP